MLVDFLLQKGFQNITVLDILAAAIDRAKALLGEKSKLVKWVVSDITEFKTDDHFDLWHDRATFHFLIRNSQIAAYLQIAGRSINNHMVVGTFSKNGPDKCSGLPIKQYTEGKLQNQLKKYFEKISCINQDHITHLQTKQNFLFSSF
ncbi:class I SAM-dependent methyltransferase [Mucilaginibacter sp. RB4R14]|uniref:class I SAM-dependent methyltransferase n=1 Tax=Mucilaginibacter aurantiaciroseus TaxID=2949308 RepID=UPI002090B001|nr:class I SAM-dependent methyltransferase [Mucilaginibacter aurantiaciroseus]MCO5934742.1 class I SAM-dependent methyltransferase [Mucilaginibacter aurantiaciroseus]